MKGTSMNRTLVALMALGVLGLASAATDQVRADTISGTGMLSGTVTAPKPFTAAKVYARHVEKNVVFMVYTEDGKYRAVNLFPGEYEVSARKTGFASDTQKIKVEPGKTATVNIALKEATAEPTYMGRPGTQFAPYDQVYKPAPARKIIEGT